MSYVIYGTSRTRITLYAADGVTPNYRITLQKEVREGLNLIFNPEGVPHQMGSGAAWAKSLTFRGFRPQLEIKWDFGLTSSVEVWGGTAWGAPADELTPISLSRIFTWAFQSPCLVEPHLDKAYSFTAQPDPGKALGLKDRKGVAHSDLDLVLVGTVVGSIPDWATL
jgi:hypothetical protein